MLGSFVVFCLWLARKWDLPIVDSGDMDKVENIPRIQNPFAVRGALGWQVEIWVLGTKLYLFSVVTDYI